MSNEILERGPDGLARVDVGGADLAYRELGTGEPVVLVHGTASDLRSWEHQLPELAESHRVIAYSRRYAWPNPDITPGADDQMLPHVDDLAALLRALDAAPAHLVGHSWGGFICLLAAIRHPELVRTLVLAEPPVLSLFTSTPPRARELLPLLVRRPRTAVAIIRFGTGTLAPAQRAFRRGDDEGGMGRFARGVLGRRGFERVPPERLQQVRDNLGSMRAQLLGAGFPPLADADVRRVDVATLLLTGEQTPPFLLRLSDRLAELLPHARPVEIAGASHRMFEERPDAANEAILRFLG